MSREFRALCALDLRLTFGRTLFRAALVVAAAAAAAAAAFGDGTAYVRLARGLALLAPLSAAFGALLGAASLAGDAASGALRAVLLRPVSRPQVVLSRAVALVLAQAALLAVGALAAYFAARAGGAFGPVVHGDGDAAFELLSATEIADAARRAALLAVPGALASALVGLAVGAFCDDAATAALVALGGVLVPAFAGAAGAATPWAWGAPGATALSVFGELAEGVQTRQALLFGADLARASALVPVAWTSAALAAAAARLARRDG
jgi:hypothetical protein